MGISRKVLDELKRELPDLQRQRAGIDTKIQGIELILSVGPQQLGRADREKRRNKPQYGPRQMSRAGSPAPHSLRRKLTDVLQQTPGLRSEELAERLRREGFRVGGATSLNERVSHELSRLRRLGFLRKKGRGKYVVAIITRPKGSSANRPVSATGAGTTP